MHGLLHNDDFRKIFLNNIRRYWGLAQSKENALLDKEKEYDKLADLARGSLDIKRIYGIMEESI